MSVFKKNGRWTALILVVIALLVAVGCAAPAPQSLPDGQGSSASSPQSNVGAVEVDPSEYQRYCDVLDQLLWDGLLQTDWSLEDKTNRPEYTNADRYILSKVMRDGDSSTAIIEIYGNSYIETNPMTGEKLGSIIYVQAEESSPCFPEHKLGVTTVTFDESGGQLNAVSCAYQAEPSPAISTLKARNKKYAEFINASSPIEVEKYDPYVVNAIWAALLEKRYIASPQEITLWDIENLLQGVSLSYSNLVLSVDEYLPENYVADAELLRLAKNLEQVHCYVPLKDYSVFENMTKLTKITFSAVNDGEVFSTLSIGKTESLIVEGFQQDMVVDLSKSKVRMLELQSWNAAVTEFKGCEQLEALSIQSTRTDMRLVNAETFPALTSLDLYFHSEIKRFRDFSQLATFDTGIIKSLSLSYLACNNDTLKTLSGVSVDYLSLDPTNGQYNPDDLDASLLSDIDVGSIFWTKKRY